MITTPAPRTLRVALLFAGLFFLLSGISCSPTCDYPAVRVAQVRLVNSLPDQTKMTVWFNGKIFKSDYPYDPPQDFGYVATFADGTPLATGIIKVVVTSDVAGKDTVITGSVTLNVNRETLVIGGRAHSASGELDSKRILLLDDQTRLPDSKLTLIRFIDIIPDFPALDAYWDSAAWRTKQPNATLQYGDIPGYSNYFQTDTLRITERGNPNNILVLVPYTFNTGGFFVTAVIRGRQTPIDSERTASVLLLSDEIGGNYIINFQTFGVRVMNATRLSMANLYILSPQDITKNGWIPRGNYPQQQQTVVNIPVDSLSGYLPLTPVLNSSSKYYFFKNNDNAPIDIMDSFQLSGAQSNDRFTFVAFNDDAVGGSPQYDELTLTDTIGTPDDPAFNRVRIIDVCPDHSQVTVTFGTRTVTMSLKQVEFFDVPVGAVTLKLSDGSANVSIDVAVNSGRPMSVYLLPKQTAGDTFLVKAITE